MANNEHFYNSANVQLHNIHDATIAVRTYGEGEPLVLIHGFIVHGYTWRKMLPKLAKRFKCYVVDLPGFGDSQWSVETDFSFTAQAARLAALFSQLRLTSYSILAHDTGASIARLVALLQPEAVRKMVLINTEIPHHRPPFIPLYQLLARLPLANLMFRSLLKIGFLVRSPLLFRPFFFDASLLRVPENLDCYVIPLKSSSQKMRGMLEYLKGIEWRVVDHFATTHREIKAETLFVWGESDPTFPVNRALEMPKQFSVRCELVRIPRAALMPHEERPEQVLEQTVAFLLR